MLVEIDPATTARKILFTGVHEDVLGGLDVIQFAGRRQRMLIATKGGHWRDGDSFPVDGRPDTLRAHCEISLRTLGVDRIGLYQLHHVDPAVPLPDSVAALEQLRQEGKITAIGLSNVTVAQLDEALAVAPVASVQNQLSYGRPDDLPTALACARRCWTSPTRTWRTCAQA